MSGSRNRRSLKWKGEEEMSFRIYRHESDDIVEVPFSDRKSAVEKALEMVKGSVGRSITEPLLCTKAGDGQGHVGWLGTGSTNYLYTVLEVPTIRV